MANNKKLKIMQLFKMTARSYTQPKVLSLGVEEHEDALQHLTWSAQ
jgi:hypothetical protein